MTDAISASPMPMRLWVECGIFDEARSNGFSKLRKDAAAANEVVFPFGYEDAARFSCDFKRYDGFRPSAA